jgi:tetratricopeptide (TPR) repeat protein
VLYNRKDLVGAEAAYRQAIRLDPKFASPHNGLGNVLSDRKDLVGAEAAYRQAIRLDPKNAYAHNGLGNMLYDRKELNGAEAAYRQAIRLDPKLAIRHYRLGVVLQARGDLTGAEAAFRQAIRLDPKFAAAHYNLGLVLRDRGDLSGAEAKYREAVRLDGKRHGAAIDALAELLRSRGKLDGAIATYEQSLRLMPGNVAIQAQLSQTRQMRQLLPRLPDVLAGKDQPKGPAEACELADLCAQPFQNRFAGAVRLYETTFAADAKLATGNRYNAACFAARAARGDGVDAPANPAERAALRGKALTWLRADLTLHKKQAASAVAADRQTAAANLTHWQGDTDLLGVREPKALEKLPAGEQEQWRNLWADVKAALVEARKPPPPPERLPPPRIESQ